MEKSIISRATLSTPAAQQHTPTALYPSASWAKFSDAQLVSNYRNGSDYAAALLVSRYYVSSRNFACSTVKNYDVASDVTSEAFISVLSAVRSTEGVKVQSFKSYLSQSVYNRAKDSLRRAAANCEYAIDFDAPENAYLTKIADDDPETLELREERLNFLEKAVAQLPDKLRNVVTMRLNGFHFKEIADELQLSINTALGRYQYALDRLRKMSSEAGLLATA